MKFTLSLLGIVRIALSIPPFFYGIIVVLYIISCSAGKTLDINLILNIMTDKSLRSFIVFCLALSLPPLAISMLEDNIKQKIDKKDTLETN